MKILLFLILLIFSNSCDLPPIEDIPSKPSQQSLANEVRNKAFVQLKQEKGLYPCGVGASMMDQIKMLALSFRYYQEVDLEKARDLLMSSGILFLQIINSTEKIQPFLQNDPFTPKNIQIRISLYTKKGLEPEEGKLTFISLIGGRLNYETMDSITQNFVTIYQETFEEAAEKLGIDLKTNL